jgi:hypothetical protein
VIFNLAIGTVIVVINAVIQAEMFTAFGNRLERVVLYLRHRLRRFANTAEIVVAVLFVLLVHTIQVWIWAFAFHWLGALPDLEPALYFAMVTFTTVGYGDIVLSPEWRLLGGVAAANGFLSFGWSTAYMVELVRRTT